MKILDARLFSIHIPFTLEITHGMASRFACDSFILRITTDAGPGYGEALVRDYVSGGLGESADVQDRLAVAAGMLRTLASPLASREMSWADLRSFLETLPAKPHELPLLCGLEGALLDCACRAEGADIHALLGLAPARGEIAYGGTLPILPPEARKKFVGLFQKHGLPNLRVKLGRDLAYAGETLAMVRGAFGPGYDVRVDANASWSYEDALAMLPVLREHGVRLIEEPFGRDREENLRFVRDPAAAGFQLAADESALTPQDVSAPEFRRTFRLVNIRRAKNGGILRALRMRDAARAGGLDIQLGCHVGETGILSALGRTAASLLPDARYVDGSYDGYILSGNVTTESFTFGTGGRAPVITGNGCGYDVDEAKLEEYANGQLACF
jgi:L-alanine-DL-glutamate epimerase-like enolase superfamily enzyme